MLIGLDAGRRRGRCPRCGGRGRPRPGSPPPRPAAVAQLDDEPVAAAADPLGLRRRSARRPRRCSRSAVGDLFAGEGLLAREQPLVALDQGHLVPRLAQACASSQPTGPPPSTIMLAGTCLAVVASRLFQARDRSSPSIGGIAAPLPVATTTAWRARQHLLADHDAALAVEAPGAAEEVDAAFFQPGQLAGVVAVVDHLVAAVEHRLRVELAARRPARRAPGAPRRARRRGAAAPSRACRRSRSIRRRPGRCSTIATFIPPSARRPAQTSPGGAGAEHDRVVGRSLAHTAIHPRHRTIRQVQHSTGATGFDVVDSCERLQVEVAGGLVKPRHKPIRADHEFALAA